MRQVAKDFGVSESCLARWLRLRGPRRRHQCSTGASRQRSSNAELREEQKRIRLLEQEKNEILRRAAAYFAQSQLPK